ncbi:MAG: hypothetical protein FJX18_01685 [Alphaproteobacteria bacterium]|nr:hypothetical protein [Alphaproteobacteria bacterium]
MKRVLSFFFLAGLWIPLIAFSSGHTASAWIADERSGEVISTIRSVCANPSYTFIDFSNLKLTDEELSMVLEGLVERQKSLGDKQTLSFIKLISPSITEEGLKIFLKQLQEGHSSDAPPDMRKVVMQVALPLTEELYDRLISGAPRLLTAGNLTLIEGS